MDLKSKLGMYKSAEGQKQSAARGEKGGEVKLPGIVVCNDDGDIFVLENRYPISYLYGGSRLGDALDINPKYLEWMNGKIESGKRSRTGTARAEGTKGKEQAAGSDVFPGAGRLLFLDTETTGLSGGAGTVAFLTGVGFFRGDEFVVRQYFMRDYDEEPAMLNELNQLLSSFDGLVTFNGRSFDWNLLYGRFIQNRIKPSVKEPVNLDLLFPARRIWSLKLESCRLSSLEENILSEYRSDDIPGALIPAVYFKYLEDGDVSEIKRVIRHNGLDVLSMVALMIKIAGMLENPMLDEPDHDLIGVGRILQAGAEFCAQAG
ncbi:MAG: ribonuclease H-like domain-containing protein, partial [Clostridiales bacterium]|nr:ribonuclease H-like domain-containing protein [Clostridiales bacterium]